MERTGEPRKRRSNRNRAEQTAQGLIAALLLGTASGCATVDMDYSRLAPVGPGPGAARPITVVLVQRGDTVASIARRYGITQRSVIDANGLRAPYDLTPGRRLILPPSASHVVAPGETVNSIARNYAVPPRAIVEANDIPAPRALTPGQKIAVPFVSPKPRLLPVPVDVAPLKPPRAPEPAAEPEIETKFVGVDPRLAGARYYAMGKPRQKPVVEDEDDVVPAKAVKASEERSVEDEAFAGRYAQARPRTKPEIDVADAPAAAPSRRVVRMAVVDDDEPEERATPVQEDHAEKATGRFLWPVQGKVISGFGRRDSGWHNDGINIACDPGSPVKAADSGVVVYDGNELTAYGNLLLVRHSSGYVTAYAHNKKLLVKRGDAVRQGQTIALAGSTGDVDRPQLHFEIRKGDRAIDPNRFLSRATASR